MKHRIFSMMLLLLSVSALCAHDMADVSRNILLKKTAMHRANNVTIKATDAITSKWNDGYVVSVTVTNNSKSAISSWQVNFSLGAGQTIINSWNGVFSSTAQNIVVTNETYNGSLAAGATTTFGFQVDNPQNTSSTLKLTATGNPSGTPVPVPSAPVLNAISIVAGSSNYTVSWNAVANATSYTLQQSTSSSFTNPTTAAQGNTTSKAFTGQANGTYYYRVSATNATGTSAWSNTQQVTVNSTPLPVPTAPTLNAISIASGSSNYTVSWNAVTNATSYTLQQSTSSSFTNPTTAAQGNTTSLAVTGQANGTYYYRVSATNASGTSAWSNTQQVTVNATPTPVPAAPVLNAISITSGSSNYTVSWNSVANASSYTLQQSTSSTFTNPTTAAQGTATSKAFTGQANGTYYYRVSATNASGTSAWSNTQQVTVNVTPPPPTGQIIDAYWESWSSDSVSSIVNMHVDVINIAFANFTSLGNHTYQIAGIDATQATVTQLVTLAHSLGKKVKISVGGASYPLAPQLQTTADAVGMAQAVATYVAANNLDGCDVDIEDNTPAAMQIAFFQNLRALMPNALITYAPETPASTSQPFADVIKGAYQYMSYFSIQDYNNYSGYNYQSDLATIMSWGVPASKICVGMMPGADDEGMQTSVAKITSISQWVLQNGLHGVMFWDLNRDLDNTTGLGVDAATNAAWAVFHS